MNQIKYSSKVFPLFKSLSVERRLDIATRNLKVFIKALTLSNPGCIAPSCYLKIMLLNSSNISLLSNPCHIVPPSCPKFVLPSYIPSFLLLPVFFHKL